MRTQNELHEKYAKRRSNRWVKYLISMGFLSAFLYAILALILLDLNPFRWTLSAQIMYGIITGTCSRIFYSKIVYGKA